MRLLSRFARPAVNFLGFSTDLALDALGLKSPQVRTVTEEEVKGLMQEGLRAGAFNKVESEIVSNALDLDRLTVRDIMTPRSKIIWVGKSDPHEAIWHKIVVSGHSHFPVYEGNRDNVVGVVSLKAIYANLAAGAKVNVIDLMTRPLIVPALQPVARLLDTFKRSSTHLALVADEFGGMAGLVTLNDVMEAIVGDFPSADERNKPACKRREDGTWLIDAAIEIADVEQALPGFRASDQGRRDFQTLAGYVMKQLGQVPSEGDTFQAGGYVFEVLDMDGHRVDKVLVLPAPAPKPEAAGESPP